MQRMPQLLERSSYFGPDSVLDLLVLVSVFTLPRCPRLVFVDDLTESVLVLPSALACAVAETESVLVSLPCFLLVWVVLVAVSVLVVGV